MSRRQDVDLATLTRVLWSGRWWILLSVAVCAVSMGVLAFLMTPIYRATTVMVPADSEVNGLSSIGSALTQFGGLASFAGINIGSGDFATEESLAVLRSRQFTERFIRELDLMPELFHRRWDESSSQWTGTADDAPTLAQAFRYFDRQVRSISQDNRTGLIRLEIEWRDREKAAAWANALVDRLNNEMRSRAIENSRASIGYLEKELESTTIVETRAAISRLMEAQINKRMLANVTQEYAFRVVDRALPADPRDMVRPKRLLMLVMGSMVGLLFGIALVLIVKRPV